MNQFSNFTLSIIEIVNSEIKILEQWVPDRDENLVTQFLAGDQQAFTKLVERHKNPIYRFILQRVRDADLAVDLTQEVFIKLFQNAHLYQQFGKFSSWLFRIAQNVAIDAFRKQKKAIILSFDQKSSQKNDLDANEKELIDNSTNLANKIEFQEIQTFIEKALAEVPLEQKEAFILSQIQGMRYQEIAQIQNCPVGTVKSRVHLALTKIRDVLKANDLL